MPNLSRTIAFRAVSGAVKNALDGHPDWVVPKDFARSVAKRAAGTLMAHAGPEVLAAARRSGQRTRLTSSGAPPGKVVGTTATATFLANTHRKLTWMASDAYRAGEQGRLMELIQAARLIKREIERLKRANKDR
jgi:hypothetical protein